MSLPSVIEAVEFRREQYGLTQKEMAKILHWGQSHYSEFVNGKLTMPKHVMAQAYEIGVPASCLFQVEARVGYDVITKRLNK